MDRRSDTGKERSASVVFNRFGDNRDQLHELFIGIRIARSRMLLV